MLISKNALISSNRQAAGDQLVFPVVQIGYREYVGAREQTKNIKIWKSIRKLSK